MVNLTQYQLAHCKEVAHPRLLCPRWLSYVYEKRKWSTTRIGQHLAVRPGNVRNALIRYKIKRRPAKLVPLTRDKLFQPQKPPKPLPLPLHKRYWLAAMIDGEGWIGSVRNPVGGFYYGISIGMTHRGVIQYCRRLTGVGKIYKRVPRGNRKPRWQWDVRRHTEIKRVLITVFPYLIVKRRQARLVLKVPPLRAKTPFLRRNIYKRLAVLNQKGNGK